MKLTWRSKMARLYLASFACSLGTLACGLFYGWSSPVLPLYQDDNSPVKMNQDEAAWIASLFTLGAAVSPIFTPAIANKIGRKILMVSTAIPSILSWIIIIFATTPWELYISRFLSGIATGIIYSITPLYLGEISPPKIRGILLTMMTLASRIGSLIEYSLCPFVSITTSSLVSMAIPIAFISIIIWIPESPYYLIRCGDSYSAEKALKLLRTETQNIDDELKLIEVSVKAESERSGGFRKLLMIRGNRKALSVAVILISIGQLSGSQAITAYTQSIFDQTNFFIEGKYLTIILGIIAFISIGICTIIVDRWGRRPLLLLSSLGCCLSNGLIAVYFTLRDIDVDTKSFEWLPAIGCTIYSIFYPIGLAGLPFTIVGELFPMNVKSLASTIAVVACNLASFVVTKTYQLIDDAFGIYVAFWLYCCCTLIGGFYIYFYVPETRQKTLQEIQFSLNFRNNKSSNPIHANFI